MKRFDAVDLWMMLLVLIWGTAFAALATVMEVLNPYQMTWFRYLPFLIFFGVWLFARRMDRMRLASASDWMRLIAAGVLGVIGYHFPINWGMSPERAIPVSAAMGSVLIATTPLWTLLFASLIGQEQPTRRRVLGSLVAFIGVIVVVFLGRPQDEAITLAKTTLVVLLAPIFWSLYSIILKPIMNKLGGLFITGMTMCIGTLVLVPFGIRQGLGPLMGFGAMGWFWMLYLSVVATVIGYVIWNQALKRKSASEVTTYIFFIPLIATAAAWLLRGETVTWWFVLGAALVIGGVSQVTRKP